jgi:hypothetical protein
MFIIAVSAHQWIDVVKQIIQGLANDYGFSMYFTDLGNMYKLLLPIHIGLAKLVQETEDYIKQTAIEAIQPLLSSSVSTAVEQVVVLKECLLSLTRRMFAESCKYGLLKQVTLSVYGYANFWRFWKMDLFILFYG